LLRKASVCAGYDSMVRATHRSSMAWLVFIATYTHPVGLGRPASLHAPLAGPEGNSS
jgi:hypothetical protein